MHKHEELNSSYLQHTQKKLEVAFIACNPVTGEAENNGTMEPADRSTAKSMISMLSERSYSKRKN